MLGSVALNYETPLAWMPFVMPSTSKTPVEMIDNGFGEETVVYRVGQKMMYITMGEDWKRDDLFTMTIDNAYVKTLTTRHGYQYPATFETDQKGGYVEASRADEKALVDFLAEQNIKDIEQRKQRGEKAITYRVVGSRFSAENGVVYENPSLPDKPPEQRKDKRLDH